MSGIHLMTLDALGIAAFACDGAGILRGMTAAAERVVREGRMKLCEGRLKPADKAAREQVATAVAQAAAAGRKTAMLLRHDGGDVLALEVLPLPDAAQEVLVVCRGRRSDDAEAIEMLRAAFQLTQAEAEVALQMARAERLQTIARERRVSEGTVRCQSKIIFAKLGVNTQAQLVRSLGAIAA